MIPLSKATRKSVTAAAVALGLLAACGDSGSGRVATSAAAERTLEASKLAKAEGLEHDAKLAGQARTFREPTDSPDRTAEFLPGSRRMPVR